jgi:hypothetical protein
MIRIRRLLFTFARSSLAGWIVGWLFAHMSFVIPVSRLRETDSLIAFHHPSRAIQFTFCWSPSAAGPV